MSDKASNHYPLYMTTKGQARLSMELAYQAYLYRHRRQSKAVNRRLNHLSDILRTAKIILGDEPAGQIHLGSTVTVQKVGSCPRTYTIAPATEATTQTDHISEQSALGLALLNHKIDDVVSLPSHNKQQHLLILAVS